jgi:hypothetical protein
MLCFLVIHYQRRRKGGPGVQIARLSAWLACSQWPAQLYLTWQHLLVTVPRARNTEFNFFRAPQHQRAQHRKARGEHHGTSTPPTSFARPTCRKRGPMGRLQRHLGHPPRQHQPSSAPRHQMWKQRLSDTSPPSPYYNFSALCSDFWLGHHSVFSSRLQSPQSAIATPFVGWLLHLGAKAESWGGISKHRQPTRQCESRSHSRFTSSCARTWLKEASRSRSTSHLRAQARLSRFRPSRMTISPKNQTALASKPNPPSPTYRQTTNLGESDLSPSPQILNARLKQAASRLRVRRSHNASTCTTKRRSAQKCSRQEC